MTPVREAKARSRAVVPLKEEDLLGETEENHVVR
jgi:hypothetical protein